jgi:putative N6-adenine-specific DNA methylase
VSPPSEPIFGSDISNTVLNAARANLEAAGLTDVVQIKQANFLDIAAPAPEGVLVMNPPYGVRLSDLKELA